MSGDLGAEVVVRAAAATLEKYVNIELLLVGDEQELGDLVTRIVGSDSRLHIRHASEVINMSEPPAEALRRKKDSSMRVAIDLVKNGEAIPKALTKGVNASPLRPTTKATPIT